MGKIMDKLKHVLLELLVLSFPLWFCVGMLAHWLIFGY